MKNLLKFASILMLTGVLFITSCEDDPAPVEVDELIGKWALSKATFIAAVAPPADPTDVLSITNFPTTQGPITLEVPSGGDVLALVTGAMADGVCTEVANYATFFLELTADGSLYLNCPAETASELSGTWVRTEDPTLGTVITLNVAAAGTTLPISFSNYAILTDLSKFSGRTQGFPMVQDFPTDLGPGNLQFMTADMEFTRLP